MAILPEELRQLIDRDKILDCITRVARGEDRRDKALLRSCFSEDASLDFGIFSGSLEKYLDWVVPGSPAVLLTQHSLGQALVELASDHARTETHVTSYHRVDMGNEQRDLIIGGRYLDLLERHQTAWRIKQRTMLYDWCQQLGASADWSQGLLGTPFSEHHFTGRARGDFSVRFFDQHANKR